MAKNGWKEGGRESDQGAWEGNDKMCQGTQSCRLRCPPTHPTQTVIPFPPPCYAPKQCADILAQLLAKSPRPLPRLCSGDLARAQFSCLVTILALLLPPKFFAFLAKNNWPKSVVICKRIYPRNGILLRGIFPIGWVLVGGEGGGEYGGRLLELGQLPLAQKLLLERGRHNFHQVTNCWGEKLQMGKPHISVEGGREGDGQLCANGLFPQNGQGREGGGKLLLAAAGGRRSGSTPKFANWPPPTLRQFHIFLSFGWRRQFACRPRLGNFRVVCAQISSPTAVPVVGGGSENGMELDWGREGIGGKGGEGFAVHETVGGWQTMMRRREGGRGRTLVGGWREKGRCGWGWGGKEPMSSRSRRGEKRTNPVGRGGRGLVEPGEF